jgi:ferric-dicitrate binding protein FerR (iron transport regulator)
MDKDQKIKNAAKYWHDENKEELPKWKKEAFKEWLEKDSSHKKTYEQMNHKSIDMDKKSMS